MGGMLGAGLFGLLSGHGFFGGINSFFGMLWLLIQIAVLFLIARWLYRRITGNRTAGSKMPFNFPGANPAPPPGGPAGPDMPPPASGAVQITPDDYQAFEKILLNVQDAWNRQDIPALQALATREMVSGFHQELATLASQGARNIVSDVKFLNGDLSEAWSESGYDYATVAMRYSLIDLTTDMTGHVLSGSSTEPTTVTEVWTFVRPSSGGSWRLSAIQQAL